MLKQVYWELIDFLYASLPPRRNGLLTSDSRLYTCVQDNYRVSVYEIKLGIEGVQALADISRSALL